MAAARALLASCRPSLILQQLSARSTQMCSRSSSVAAAAVKAQHQQQQGEVPHEARARRPPDAYRACFIDAAGTLLSPSEPAAEVYQRYSRKYMPEQEVLPQDEILRRFRRAYSTPWAKSSIRYVGDGRPFWRYIVQEASGCYDEAMFEEVYSYYADACAWTLAPGAAEALHAMREAGVMLACVSNFDTRLRPILAGLGVAHFFDAILVSAEVGWEKPNRCIFEAALEAMPCHVQPEEVVHVGDDRRNDLWGARDAGLHAWLWGKEGDVSNFAQLAHRVIHGSRLKEWSDSEEQQWQDSL